MINSNMIDFKNVAFLIQQILTEFYDERPDEAVRWIVIWQEDGQTYQKILFSQVEYNRHRLKHTIQTAAIVRCEKNAVRVCVNIVDSLTGRRFTRMINHLPFAGNVESELHSIAASISKSYLLSGDTQWTVKVFGTGGFYFEPKKIEGGIIEVKTGDRNIDGHYSELSFGLLVTLKFLDRALKTGCAMEFYQTRLTQLHYFLMNNDIDIDHEKDLLKLF